MTTVITKRILSCKYSSMLTWDFAANYLKSINTCSWESVPLSQLAIIRKEEVSQKEIQSGEVLLLDRISFDEGYVFAGDKKETKMKQYRAYKGDIVVSKINARKGAIGIINSNTPVGTTIHFRVLVPDNNLIITKFLHMALRSTYCMNQFEIFTGGQGKGEISEDRLLSIKIPIPPLPIQKKIVAHWEATKSKINSDLNQSNEITMSIPEYLVKMLGLEKLGCTNDKRAFVSRWQEMGRWGVGIAREMFRSPKLSDSPYPVVALSKVIKNIQNGWSPKCMNRPAEIDEWGVLKLGAVSFGWFDESQNKALPPGVKPKEQFEVKPGDFFIIRGNVPRYVGACALVTKVRSKLIFCDLMFKVIWEEESKVLPQFLDEILKIHHLRWQIENNLTGTSPTMKKITKPALMALRFPLPPLDIQRKIINEVKTKRNKARILKVEALNIRKIATQEIEQMILGTHPVEVL